MARAQSPRSSSSHTSSGLSRSGRAGLLSLSRRVLAVRFKWRSFDDDLVQQREGVGLVVVERVEVARNRFAHHLFLCGVAFAGPELLDLTDADANGLGDLVRKAPHLEGRQQASIDVRCAGSQMALHVLVEDVKL